MATSETLRSVIDAGRTSRRLDELSAARVIGKVALQVHAAQQKAGAGKSVGPISPSGVGLAPTGEASVELPATGALGYCAPEQVTGGAGDRRSDVFSLGIVMWEALTHQRLFDAMNDAAVKTAVTEREIKTPAEINANIPAELSAICMRALARNPADRYQSAKSMAVEIEEFLEEAGYADNDDQIAAYLADLGKPRQEKKVTLPPANRIVAPAEPLPSVLTAPTQPPSVLKSTSQPTGTAIANALANAATAPAAPSDKATTSPGLGPSVLVAPAGNARTANGTAPPPLVPMPPILPSTTMAGTGAPSRAELEAEVAKVEAAKAEAARIEAAKVEAEKAAAANAEAARIEAAKAETARIEAAAEVARVEAAKAEAAVAEAARAAAARAEAVKAEAAKAEATESAKAEAKKANASQTVIGIGAITHTPAPPTTAETAPAQPTAETVQPPAATAQSTTAETVQLPAATAQSTTAETVQLAAATAKSPDDAAPVTPMAGPDSRPSRPGTSPPHPASVVSLPQGKDKDVLAGWGWGTGSHEAISDDDDLDLPASTTNNRKLLMYLVGGGVAFTALVVIIAFGFGGSKKKPAPPPAAQTQEWNQIGSATPDSVNGSAGSATGEAAMTGGSAATGSADLGSAVAAGSADLGSAVAAGSATTGSDSTGSATAIAATTPAGSAASTMVATTETTKPETTKPETSRPPVIAKTTTKATTKTTPKTTTKATPKTTARTTRTTRSTTGTPVDPYAETKPSKATAKASKVDVETAYRTGLQQFARGDTTGALASLRTSLAGNPNHAPTWRALGLVFEKLGEKDQARAAYKRYLQLAPSAGDAGQIRSRLERL